MCVCVCVHARAFKRGAMDKIIIAYALLVI